MNALFEVHLTRNAERDLSALRDLTVPAIKAVLALNKDPYKGHPLKGSLRGVRALEFSLKGAAYRAAYVILNAERICLVFMVGPHEGFYQEAERRARALGKR